MKIIDITNFSASSYNGMSQWLIDNCGPAFKGDGVVLMSGDTWRIYRQENSVEGYFETSILLEFDRDSDATAFLLKWV